jgi:NADPH:quinone reductase-like Zn-dependent oxidoreductase
MPPENSPAQLVRYDALIRLTCFTPTAANADQAAFCEAWTREANTAPAAGVLYRELNRQVPEWSQLAAREMDYPIPATLLEYLIVEPGTDLSRLPALPQGFAEVYSLTQDLYTVAFRFVKETSEAGGALMFNLFEVDGPAGMEQGFLMDWPPRGEFKIHESATLSTMLHQRVLPHATFKAFNRAEVTSAEAYAEGIERFEAAFPRKGRKAAAGSDAAAVKPPIRSHLGLFETVARLQPSAETHAQATMGAAVLEDYGPPEVLRWQQISRPNPGPGQVRMKVKASSINPLDVKMRSGEVRHIYPSWFPDVLGYSFAGVIDAVGEGVSERRVGEEVYGINNPIMRHGYAEYVVGPARFFYPKPQRLDWAAAAAAPSVFATAYGALFLRAHLQKGQTVLIHGAAGVIGSCAVQLARRAGAHVIGTASGKNVERIKQLGADVVVDYRTQRFEDFAHDVDMVLDTVGGETRERSWPLIRKGGVLASLLPPPPDPAVAARYGVQAFMVHGHPDIGEIMPEMTALLEQGALESPEVAATYPLSEAVAAHAAFEASSPKGRIVLLGD